MNHPGLAPSRARDEIDGRVGERTDADAVDARLGDSAQGLQVDSTGCF